VQSLRGQEVRRVKAQDGYLPSSLTGARFLPATEPE